MNAINIPHMLTIRECAQETGLSEHFLRRKALSGEIVSVRAGTKILINLDRLIEHLNSNTLKVEENNDAVNGITPIQTKL